MGTKRVELSELQVVEIMWALRAQGQKYVELSEVRADMQWTDAASYYRKCADRCFGIIVMLEECDTVTIETDGSVSYQDGDHYWNAHGYADCSLPSHSHTN